MTARLRQGRFNRPSSAIRIWEPTETVRTTRRRWLEPKTPTKKQERALSAALDAGNDTAAWWVLRAPHRLAALRWAALADAAGAIDLFGGRPWPGLIAAAATAEALRRRGAYRYPKGRERPGRERFNWVLEPAGIIYRRFASERSEARLARAIGQVVDQEGMGDYCAIGLELLRERVRQRGRLSADVRKELAPAFAAKEAIARALALEVVAAARRPGGATR